MKQKNYAKTKWKRLSSELKDERKRALQVLGGMRKSGFLTVLAKEVGITAYKVKKHLGRSIRKKKGKWLASKTDRIERSMLIYARGKQKTIILSSSQDASLIGSYFNAVGQYLETGDESVLKLFKKVRIKDASGKFHKLETRPEKLHEIDDKKENSELFEIYEVED